jgi:hypothetical protein
MKIQKFIKETGFEQRDNSCVICALHDAFNHGVECPQCGQELEKFNLVPITESNTCNPDEKIITAPVKFCDGCGAVVALIPTEIIWNANHGIYYIER